MNDSEKTKADLIAELETMRRRVAELEVAESRFQQTEEALRKSEAQYRLLFEMANDIIFIHPLATQEQPARFTQVNDVACQVLGYEREELLQLSPLDIIAGQDLQVVPEEGEKLTGEGHLLFEKNLIAKSGKYIPVEIHASLCELDGQPIIFSIARDITKRKQAEEALQLSMARYDDLVANIPVGVYIFWIRTDGTMEFEYVSKRWCEIHQLSREAVLADVSVANALVHPEELNTFLTLNREASRSFKPFSWEGRFVIKGEIRWMRVQSTPSVMENGDIRWFGMAQDITDRKRAEEALALERDRAQKYLDIVGSIIVALDTKGRVQLINKAGCEILGYDEREIIGKNWIDTFLPTGSRAEVREIFGALTAGQLEPFQQLENRVLTKAGEERIISWHNVVVTDEAGRITGTLSSGQDVTDRKRAEEKLRESEEKYRLLFDSSDVLVSVYDRQGICQLMNRKVAALFGDEPEAFIGKSFEELHLEAAEEYTRRIRQAIDSGLAREYEDEVRFFQGKRWLLSRVHPVPDAYGDFHTAQIISHDITDRKRAEERLRKSEEKYRLLVESLNEGIWYIDREACTTFVNPRMAEMLGYTVEEMQGKPLFEFMDERGEKIARQNLQRREKGIGEQHDFEFIRKDGRRIYTSLEATPILAGDGRYLGALAGIQDITERRQAEVALRHYADRLRILHQIDAAILAAQSPPAIAQAALERLHDIIPYHRASISQIDLPRQRGRVLIALTSEGPVEVSKLGWQSLAGTGDLIETVQQGRTRLVQDIAALETASPLEQNLAASGARACVSVPMIVREELWGTLNLAVASPDFFRPDHVETLEEIAASLAVALQQARLLEQTQQDAEAKTMLLREVNHRVMNNLSMILYILDMEQQRGLENQADFQAALQDVTTRIQGIATVHRMLSQAQQDSLELGQVVSQIIQAALSGSPIQDRLQVRVEGPEVSLNLTAKQAITVALIINELTTNSIKYAFQDRSQGRIQVEICSSEGAEEPKIVHLTFRDDGPGLPAEVLAGRERNVGLWLVEANVTHTLRGEIEFRNDVGAVVTLTFAPTPLD